MATYLETLLTEPQSPESPTWLDYLEEDDEGMPEGDDQREYISYATKVLRMWYQHQSQVYVSGNLLIRYKHKNEVATIAPDTFVVFGVSNRNRSSYTVWEENYKTPSFALEITSQSTANKDQRDKPLIYSQLGVQEYIQYDPTGQYLKPCPLVGMTLVGRSYQPLPVQTLPNGILVLQSAVLQLEIRLLPEGLRFYDPAKGVYLFNHEESEQARLQAEQERSQEQQARLQAEQARLQAEQLARSLAEKLRSLGVDPDLL